jgi:hypothetical protein
VADATYDVSAVASASVASKRHLAVFNGTGSAKVMRILDVWAAPAPTAAVTGGVIPLTVFRLLPPGPTFTAPIGTDAPIAKADTTDPNPPTAVKGYANATTVTGEDTVAFGAAGVSGEETATVAARAELYEFSITGAAPLTCREGQGIVVKQGAFAPAGNVTIGIEFTLADT